MSLICVHCGKIIVMSNNPDHLGCCAGCGASSLTKEEREQIEKSSQAFSANVINKAMKYAQGKEDAAQK